MNDDMQHRASDSKRGPDEGGFSGLHERVAVSQASSPIGLGGLTSRASLVGCVTMLGTVVGCFVAPGVQGAACTTSASCGGGLECIDGVCGGLDDGGNDVVNDTSAGDGDGDGSE